MKATCCEKAKANDFSCANAASFLALSIASSSSSERGHSVAGLHSSVTQLPSLDCQNQNHHMLTLIYNLSLSIIYMQEFEMAYSGFSLSNVSEVLGFPQIGALCKHRPSSGVVGEAGALIAHARLHAQQRLHAFHRHVRLLPHVLPSD